MINLPPIFTRYNILTPWENTPYQLITWWDMEQFTLEILYDIGKFLEKAKQYYSQSIPQGEFITILPEEIDITEQERSDLIISLETIKKECNKISLRNSEEAIEEFKTRLTNWRIKTFDKITHGKVAMYIDEIDRAIHREMKLHLFMYIPVERAKYYLEPSFGLDVDSKFPSIKYDTTEAGKSFATARYTGCVFHLMRVLEIGLTSFAKMFSIPSDHTNWEPIIDRIENKIRDMGSDPNKPPNWKKEQEFYTQVANGFMFFKNAWRNYTMHVRGKYTEEEAELIMINVRAFMQKLATKISE